MTRCATACSQGSVLLLDTDVIWLRTILLLLQAVGIDFSQHFVDAAEQMKERGQMQYEAHIQGDIHEVRSAKLPEGAKPINVVFQQGDACTLSPSLGEPAAGRGTGVCC
jgi:hypothetical protein